MLSEGAIWVAAEAILLGATATGALLARWGSEANSSAILTRHDQASIAELTGWPQKGRQQDARLTQNGAYL